MLCKISFLALGFELIDMLMYTIELSTSVICVTVLVWESSRYIPVRLLEYKIQSLFIYYNSCPNSRIEKHDINNSEAKILKERLIFWFHWQLKWKTQKMRAGYFRETKLDMEIFFPWRLICRYSNRCTWFVQWACRHLEYPVNRLRGLSTCY